MGQMLDGISQEAEIAGRRQVDSSSSQTSFESEPIVRRRLLTFKQFKRLSRRSCSLH